MAHERMNMNYYKKSNIIKTAFLTHREPAGNNGGAITAGAYRVAQFNTIESDEIGISLSGGTITIPEGRYQCIVTHNLRSVSSSRGRAFDPLNNVMISPLAADRAGVDGGVRGSFFIGESVSQFEIQVRVQTSRANGWGNSGPPSVLGDTECFGALTLIKL